MTQKSPMHIFVGEKPNNTLELFDKLMKPSFSRHSMNVASYAVGMWKILVKSGNKSLAKFAEQDIFLACALHDIGKSFISDDILSKNGPLNDAEYAIVKQHPKLGQKALNILKLNKKGINSTKVVVACHHERWDGTGYPYGIAGETIPAIARLCAIADTYDAITSDRPYRKGSSSKQALKILDVASGSQLDKSFVSLLLKDTSWIAAAKPEKIQVVA